LSPDSLDTIAQAAELLGNARHAVALTGAGISVESGVPAFRGSAGLWDKYPAEEYATLEAFVGNPKKVWALFKELYEILKRAEPNAAHVALAQLEAAGVLKGVVTQNIDNLHQRAGSKNVIEFHGTMSELECLNCGSTVQFDESLLTVDVPCCACGGVLKPKVILFGETIPFSALEEAEREAMSCDLMLVIGTSAQVVPASVLPLVAKRCGAAIIEMNVERTHLSEHLADLSVSGSVGLTLPKVAEQVLAGYIGSPTGR